jgi:hypothetical protein
MRFGTKVLVHRGGHDAPGPGCNRWVRGVLVGAFDHQVEVRLLEDDPLDTVGWNKKGMVGIWERSAIKEAK